MIECVLSRPSDDISLVGSDVDRTERKDTIVKLLQLLHIISCHQAMIKHWNGEILHYHGRWCCWYCHHSESDRQILTYWKNITKAPAVNGKSSISTPRAAVKPHCFRFITQMKQKSRSDLMCLSPVLESKVLKASEFLSLLVLQPSGNYTVVVQYDNAR